MSRLSTQDAAVADRTATRSRPVPVPLDGFELIEPIGAGGMARVWRSRHKAYGQLVAIKVMAGAAAHTALFREAFRNEARAVASLDHPNIIRLFDYGEVDEATSQASDGQLTAGTPFLAMELARGGTLSQQRQPLSWPVLRQVLLQLLEALGHAHARQVIHLDLKPANVLIVDPDPIYPIVKLSDFGISYLYGESQRDRTIFGGVDTPWCGAGTPAYMAPEQFSASWRDFGPWTDLYALGCLAWRLCTGQAPFSRGSAQAMMWAHFTQEPGSLISPHPLPPEFEPWLRRLLEKSFHDRFLSAADAAWPLVMMTLPSRASQPSRPDGSELFLSTTREQEVNITSGPTELSEAELLPDDSETITQLHTREVPDSDKTINRPIDQGSDAPALLLAAQPIAHPGIQTSTRAPLPPIVPPPFPMDWRNESLTPDRRPLPGAGLGLFGLRTPPLVGRTVARDRLWQALADVHRTHHTRMVVVQGPAGIGKSRLARWFAERAMEVGAAELLKGQFSRNASSSTALAKMLSNHMRLSGLTRPAAHRRVGELLARLGSPPDVQLDTLLELVCPSENSLEESTVTFPSEPRRPGQNRSQEHHALFRSWFQATAKRRPLILWLDDVQWGEDALELVTQLLDAPFPILIVLTAQTEALRDRPFANRQLQSLLKGQGTQALELMPLAEAEQLALVREVVALDDALAVQVVRRSGGNPLFAIQLVGDWLQRGLLEPGPHGQRLRGGQTVSLPNNIHQLWIERLQRAMLGMPEAAWVALEVAAVLGHEVARGEWEQVCLSLGQPVPEGLLSALLKQQLVEVVRQNQNSLLDLSDWSFAHGLLRESLERHAREHHRWTLINAACARLLMDRQSLGKRGDVERMSLHLLASGKDEAALEPLLRAARQRANDQEWHEAARLLDLRDAAIHRLHLPEHDLRRAEGNLERITACWRILSHAEIDRLVQPALAALTAHPDLPLYRVALRITAIQEEMKRNFSVAIPLFQDVIACSRQHNDMESLSICLFVYARCLTSAGRLMESELALRECLSIQEKFNDSKLIARTQTQLAKVLQMLHRYDEALALHYAALPVLQLPANREDLANCLKNMGTLKLAQLDWQGAIPYFEQALRIDEHLRFSRGIAHQHMMLGEAYRAGSRFAEAEAHYQQALERYEALGLGLSNVALGNLTLLDLARGNYHRALERVTHLQGLRTAAEDAEMSLVLDAVALACAAAFDDWTSWDAHWQQLSDRPPLESALALFDLLPLRLAAELATQKGQPRRARHAYQLALSLWPPHLNPTLRESFQLTLERLG